MHGKLAENRLLQECHTWFFNNYMRRGIAIGFHVPNENSHTRPGVVSGVPDYFILAPAMKVLLIEFKTQKGQLTDAQIEFKDLAEKLGYSYFVIRSFDNFKKTIQAFLDITLEAFVSAYLTAPGDVARAAVAVGLFPTEGERMLKMCIDNGLLPAHSPKEAMQLVCESILYSSIKNDNRAAISLLASLGQNGNKESGGEELPKVVEFAKKILGNGSNNGI